MRESNTPLEARMRMLSWRPSPQLGILGAALAIWMLIAAPAQAQQVPSKILQEVLIKATLLTFNDANVTGNYTVLHAKLSKPFRDQFPPARLKEVFKSFADNNIDFDIVAAKVPVTSKEPKVSENGVLSLEGYFDTTPSHVYYDLEFIMSDGEWKAIKINVKLRKPDEK
jgi:hypothetical protein